MGPTKFPGLFINANVSPWLAHSAAADQCRRQKDQQLDMARAPDTAGLLIGHCHVIFVLPEGGVAVRLCGFGRGKILTFAMSARALLGCFVFLS